ncbi:hypothetical protein HBB16_07750 [Pseudonocardia sp. MCCB 268]|nr:hypothetical protein [Pseudonocardia cytotoxica]
MENSAARTRKFTATPFVTRTAPTASAALSARADRSTVPDLAAGPGVAVGAVVLQSRPVWAHGDAGSRPRGRLGTPPI